MQDTETLQLSEEELKLLEEYRSGKFNKLASGKVIEQEDLAVLNEMDSSIKTLLYEIGLIEERKSYIMSALESSRKKKNSLLQEVMLKYGIPANQPFKINRDSGTVEFEIHDQDLSNLN